MSRPPRNYFRRYPTEPFVVCIARIHLVLHMGGPKSETTQVIARPSEGILVLSTGRLVDGREYVLVRETEGDGMRLEPRFILSSAELKYAQVVYEDGTWEYVDWVGR